MRVATKAFHFEIEVASIEGKSLGITGVGSVAGVGKASRLRREK
jgi:hypothetical protein